MDPAAGNALGTALNVLGFVSGVAAVAVSALAWNLSRAGKIRSYENRLHEQLLNAATRIETIETRWTEERQHLELLEDEIRRGMEGTRKERQKLTTANQRAEQAAALGPNGGGAAGADMATLPREEQLRLVQASLRGA